MSCRKAPMGDTLTLETKKQRGQFFTVSNRVQEIMSALLTQPGEGIVLEPSAGAGDLAKRVITDFPGSIVEAWELDETIVPRAGVEITYGNFFSLAEGRDNAFSSIIGNPPYVGWKSVEEATRNTAADIKNAYSDKTNLYHLFLDRCIDLLEDGGEMVMIVPKEWLYTTSAAPLRQKFSQSGALTHVIDGGEEKVFPDADIPAIMIFRFVKGMKQDSLLHRHGFSGDEFKKRTMQDVNGRWLFLTPELNTLIEKWGRFGDNFKVRVGIVSGADGIFRTPWGDDDIEPHTVRNYLTTRGVEEFLDVSDLVLDEIPINAMAYLEQNKTALISRRISKFDESNWWKYGAIRNKAYMESNASRFYAYGKTRLSKPFFIQEDACYYSGGILGIFQEPSADHEKEDVVRLLNSPGFFQVFDAMLITTGNKVSFQPSTLEDVPFPRNKQQVSEALALML